MLLPSIRSRWGTQSARNERGHGSMRTGRSLKCHSSPDMATRWSWIAVPTALTSFTVKLVSVSTSAGWLIFQKREQHRFPFCDVCIFTCYLQPPFGREKTLKTLLLK